MIAYTYPLLNIFWTMFIFVGFFIWIWLLIVVFMDVFRSHDIGGFAKALWIIFIIILPLLGVLVYLIARGGKMHQRAEREARDEQQSFDAYVKDVAGSSSADELAKLSRLKEQGVLSDAEFESQKAKILG